MANVLPTVSRRRLLGGVTVVSCLGASCFSGGARAAPRLGEIARSPGAEPFPSRAVLLAAGPDDGRMDHWGRLLAPHLERALPAGCLLDVMSVGGVDGVTGANQFEARVLPDGATTLLVPGSAALAWIAGDPRAQFDAGRWVPVLAASGPGVVVVRSDSPRQLRGSKIRIGSAGPVGPDMPALLALDLLGAQIVPLTAAPNPASALAALAGGAVDAVFLRGPGTVERVAALAGHGAIPLFSLGALTESGGVARDPLLPDVPAPTELPGGRFAGPLFDGWRAATAASGMEFGLMLPQLTPASSIALWRRAGEQAAVTPPVQALCSEQAVRPITAPAAATLTMAITANASGLLELRHWLSARFHWHPA